MLFPATDKLNKNIGPVSHGMVWATRIPGYFFVVDVGAKLRVRKAGILTLNGLDPYLFILFGSHCTVHVLVVQINKEELLQLNTSYSN